MSVRNEASRSRLIEKPHESVSKMHPGYHGYLPDASKIDLTITSISVFPQIVHRAPLKWLAAWIYYHLIMISEQKFLNHRITLHADCSRVVASNCFIPFGNVCDYLNPHLQFARSSVDTYGNYPLRETGDSFWSTNWMRVGGIYFNVPVRTYRTTIIF